MNSPELERKALTRAFPMWAVLLVTLLLLNLGWMLSRWVAALDTGASAKQFGISHVAKDGMRGVGLSEMNTGQHIWVKWDFLQNGAQVEEHDYFFRGKEVFSVWSKTNHPPVYSVYFHGPGKSFTRWQNRAGADTFTQRSFYDTNGVLFRDEVWFENAWRPLEWREGKSGILVDGQWQKLWFASDGAWTTNAPRELPSPNDNDAE